MASLTGQTIQSTYDALLKISGNDALTSSLQRITDGLGNFSPLYLSTTAVEISSGLNVVGSITGSNLSGTNTGDETNSTIKSKLGAATSSNDGYLTSTDWSTFNAKQNALGYTPVPNTRSLTINGTAYDLSADRSWSVGTVTSVGLSVPTGFAVSNSPVTGSGTLGLSFAAGYSLPTNLSQASWDTAFSSRIATFTTTGNSGAATFASNTLNIPNYTLSGLGGVPTTRTLTINGTSYDLSADRSWTISTGLSGSGTTNYIPKFTGSTSLGNSLIFDNGTNVGIGTTSPSVKLQVVGDIASSGFINSGSGIENSTLYAGYIQFYNAAASNKWIKLADDSSTINAIGFSKSGSASTVWFPTGNVGIGTSNPGRALEVYTATSDTRIAITNSNSTSGAAKGFELLLAGSDAYAYNYPNGALIFGTNASERMRITSGGNVGIGTSSPSERLHVVGNGLFSGSVNAGTDFRTDGGTVKVGAGSTNYFTQISTAYNFPYVDSYLDSYAGVSYEGRLNFRTNSAGGALSTKMTITNGGNVGIGTSSPSQRLDVSGNARVGGGGNPEFTISGTDGAYTGLLNINAAGGGISKIIANGGSNILAIETNGGERMRITSGGNVGIGTSSPARTLDINGTIAWGASSGRYMYAGGTSHIFAYSDSNLNLLYSGGSGGFGINNAADSARIFQVTDAGNVGIGTFSPAYRLDVNGDIRSTGVIRVNTGTIDTVMTFDTGAGAIGTLTNHNLNFWINGTAQAKITTGNQFYVGTGVVNGSAKVQIDSTTQGFLPPRMTSLQRIAIATPAVGLIVYQTDNAGGLGGNEGLYVYKSGGWTFII